MEPDYSEREITEVLVQRAAPLVDCSCSNRWMALRARPYAVPLITKVLAIEIGLLLGKTESY